jgi:hypothetical protein
LMNTEGAVKNSGIRLCHNYSKYYLF